MNVDWPKSGRGVMRAVCVAGSLVCATFLPPAWGDLTDLKVYSPNVEKGEMEFEAVGNTTFDDDQDADAAQHHEFEISYAVTDRWATSVTASLIKSPGENLRYDILGWENTFQLTPRGRYWLDLGLHLEVELEDEGGRPNNFETRLILERTAGNYQHTFNLNFEQEWGEHSRGNPEVEYIWRSRRQLGNGFQAGFEIFGGLGELAHLEPLQEHRIGPAIYFDLGFGKLELESKLTWLFGLTEESPDHTLHWHFQFQF